MSSAPKLVVLSAALLALAALPAQAQWLEQVASQIEDIETLMEAGGFRIAEEMRTGSLDDGGQESSMLSLDAGRQYMIWGVCDHDCTDIDLRLFDDDGDPVDVDIELDDTPLVEVHPDRSATYRVQVVMASCSANPCYYGVGIFQEGGVTTTLSRPADGRSYRGELQKGDETLRGGEYVDVYYFQARSGQRIVIDLSSLEFDPYIIVRQPSGKQTENDDYEASQSRSRVDMVADESGEWQVLVTSYQPGEGGAYEVIIAVDDRTGTDGLRLDH